MTGTKKQKTPEGLPAYVDSLKQAVAELSAVGYTCDENHLKKAKRERVKSFVGTRVRFNSALFEWLDANPFSPPLPEAPTDEDALEPKDVLERRKLREQFLAAKHKRLVEEGKYIALAEFKDRATRAVAQFRASLNGLRVDAPQWAGMQPHEILRRVTEKTDEGFRDLETAFRKLANG